MNHHVEIERSISDFSACFNRWKQTVLAAKSLQLPLEWILPWNWQGYLHSLSFASFSLSRFNVNGSTTMQYENVETGIRAMLSLVHCVAPLILFW